MKCLSKSARAQRELKESYGMKVCFLPVRGRERRPREGGKCFNERSPAKLVRGGRWRRRRLYDRRRVAGKRRKILKIAVSAGNTRQRQPRLQRAEMFSDGCGLKKMNVSERGGGTEGGTTLDTSGETHAAGKRNRTDGK